MDADDWFVYMLLCRGDGLYVGITKDVIKRVRKHRSGKAALFTRLNPPVELFALRSVVGYAAARREERNVKKLDRGRKLLWARSNPVIDSSLEQLCSAELA